MNPILKERNRACRWIILTQSEASFECYRDWNIYFRQMVAYLKQTSWHQFLETPTEKTVFKAFQSTKSQGFNTVIPLRDDKGKIHGHQDQLSNLLFHGTLVVNAPINISDIRTPPWDQSATLVDYPPVTEEEVLAAIGKIAPKKSPGIDGIHKKYLKVMSTVLAPIFKSLFNHLLSTGLFPAEWKCAIIAILRKANKGDYSNPAAYRPIALLSGVSKLFELIIARRVWEDKL
jgi:hypothetical protein